MQDFLWTIIGWICKGVSVMALLILIIGVCHVIKFLVTNGNRKWHYYEPDKPWKGGYWAPLLPDYPPYNEYEWNPETCRHEHKVTGEPLYDCKQPMRLSNKKAEKIEWDWDALGMPDEKPIILPPPKTKKRPEWLRFLLEEISRHLSKSEDVGNRPKRENRKILSLKEIWGVYFAYFASFYDFCSDRKKN